MLGPSTIIRWNRSSSVLLAGFFLLIFLIIYIWWPLADEVLSYIDWNGPWWLYLDWLLIGLFLFMSLNIVACADLRRDALIIFIATVGGLVIEAWGTQTNLWFYYTSERPPLWIVPAWPIATLCIDRMTRLLDWTVGQLPRRRSSLLRASWLPARTAPLTILYWCVFLAFLAIMLAFIAPTLNKPYTLMALFLCVLLIANPPDHRRSLLVFSAGAGLGYFLELWGTTRQCWTYYTYQAPPLFAVLAHGMAAVAFWRTGLVLNTSLLRLSAMLRPQPDTDQPL